MTNFCKTYMALQGTEVLKQSRKPSSANPCIVITDCPEDAAKHDCEGCKILEKCKEENAKRRKTH